MSPGIGVPTGRRSLAVALALALAATIVAAVPAAAAPPTVTRIINNHFHVEAHYPADYSCGPYGWGVTEIADGNEHLVVMDDGTNLAVTYGETFQITAIPDDPTIPSNTRQGTDALSFVARRDGDVVFHESFHDFGPAAWDQDAQIRLVTTFTTKDGDVLVDHTLVNDWPPPGC